MTAYDMAPILLIVGVLTRGLKTWGLNENLGVGKGAVKHILSTVRSPDKDKEKFSASAASASIHLVNKVLEMNLPCVS